MKTFLAFTFCVFSLVMLAITSTGAVASIESAMTGSAGVVTAAAQVLKTKDDVGSIKAIGDANDPDTGIPPWLQITGLVISAASTIAALTPTPKDDGVLLILRKVIDLFGMNWFGAKNAGAVNRKKSDWD